MWSIDFLQRLHLRIRPALVRCLVRRFDVDADQIVVRQCGDGGAALGGVIGIEIARRAGHVDALPAEQHADAAHQIDGADDRPASCRISRRTVSSDGARPWPQSQICVARACPFARRARFIGMIAQDRPAAAPSSS